MSGAVPPLSTHLRGEHIDNFNLPSSFALFLRDSRLSKHTHECGSCM